MTRQVNQKLQPSMSKLYNYIMMNAKLYEQIV